MSDPGKLRTYTLHGRKYRAHPECRPGFVEDRKHGLIYGPYKIREEDGSERWAMTAESFSWETETCPYCGVGA